MTRTAWITGTSRGLGAAIARRLAASDLTILGFARDDAGQQRTADSVRAAGGTFHPVRCDLGDRQQRRRTFADSLQEHGPANILIHNAGWGGPRRPLLHVDDDQWDRALDLNVTVAFELTRLLLPAMQQKPRHGRIVHIGSVLSLRGAAGSAAYIAAKHALLGLVRATAAECRNDEITCNLICPGYLATDMTRDAGDALGPMLARTPKGRLGTVEEVADLVAWLCSPAAAYVHGAALSVDGGLGCDLG
ncbi:MAG: SDR family oxidoreductase [Planctomycetes bacterium]|nr:SDR family oxidoreductase [Planctomycetota bacterium]